MKLLLPAAMTLVLAIPSAFAIEQPKAGKLDARIRYVDYKPDQIVELWTQPGAIMEIQFGEGESVPEGNVAATDGSRLERKPRGNMLYLKLKGCLDPEPLLVTTKTAAGTLRPYRFQIESRGSDCSDHPPAQPGAAMVSNASLDGAPPPPHAGNLKYIPANGLGAGADVIYAVVFKYPAEEAAKRQAAWRTEHAEDQKRQAQKLLKQQMTLPYGNKFDGTWNFRYAAHGSPNLTPSEVRDDGWKTVFGFPQMDRVPALFRWQPGANGCNREHDDRNEATVIPSVHKSGAQGDTVIADGISQGWCLRDGNTILEIRNLGYTLAGSTPATGTASPAVERIIKGDRE